VIARAADAPPADLGGAELHAIVEPPLVGPGEGRPAAEHLAYAAAVYREVARIHARSPVDAVLAPLWCCEGVVCSLDDRFPTVVSCMTSMTTMDELSARPATREERELIALEGATLRRARYAHALTRAGLQKALADYAAEPALTGYVPRGVSDRARGPEPEPTGAWDGMRGPRVLFAGRLEHRKGVDVLLEAARRLAAESTEFGLVLAGRDTNATATGEPYRTAFERQYGAEPELARRVRFVGPVDDTELERLYRGADLLCGPSRYESHGVVLVEAMMFGKPIVACAAGGMPEVVEDGANALLAEPGDADSLVRCMRRLIDDAELRRRYGTRSRALYEERFEAGAAAAGMATFLAEVGAQHERASAPPDDLADRLTAVVGEVLELDSAEAGRAAEELLAPSADAWRAAALDAERRRGAWQDRALMAESERSAAQAALAAVTGSLFWRLIGGLRRVAARLRAIVRR
jgi:hypothetical protein